LGVVRPGMGCRAGLEKKDVEPALWCVMIQSPPEARYSQRTT
jgi:hypothetical protein